MDNNTNITEISDLLKRDGIDASESTQALRKPYSLRKLTTKDISPMIKILKKINIKRIKETINQIDLKKLVKPSQGNETEYGAVEVETENTKSLEIDYASIGKDLIFELIPLVLDAIDDCLPEINKLLANVANIEIEELENYELDIYFNLIYDFINKEEFKGFIKVASKFAKLEN